MMIGRLSTFALACFAVTSGSAATELMPGHAHGIHLLRFDGVVYYTIEQDGYRVVATLASGAEEVPIRFISTLGPGQRVMISVPRSVDQPSVDFEILRDGDALIVGDPSPAATVGLVSEEAIGAALDE